MVSRKWNIVDLRAGSESKQKRSTSDFNGAETLILLYGDVQGRWRPWSSGRKRSRVEPKGEQVKYSEKKRVEWNSLRGCWKELKNYLIKLVVHGVASWAG